MNKLNMGTRHPIMDLQGNAIFAGNGNVVLGYTLKLPEVHSLSSTDFDELHSTWFQAFKSLPVGTVIHKQDVYLKKSYSADKLPKNTFLSKATQHYFKGRDSLDHQSYLFFILTKNRALNNAKYVNPFQKVSHSIPESLDESISRFKTVVNDAASFINNSRKIIWNLKY
jgi:conjugal transfer ATP-binding protein TraC